MTDADISVEPLRRDDLKRLKPLVWSTIDLNPIGFNTVGAFTVTVPASQAVWDLIEFDEDGNYLPNPFLVNWMGVYQVPVFAEQWSPAKVIDDAGNVTETITFSGADMLAILANRIVYRDATLPWSGQTVGTTTVTGPAETVIKSLVQANVVDAAETDRQFPNLVVADDLGRGDDVTYQIVIKDSTTTDDVAATIGPNLMEMVRTVASQFNIGVRVDLVDGQFVFDCYIPRDLSGHVVFSEQLGNLRAYNLTDAVPTGNAVLTQTGATTGAFTETAGAGGTDPWRRVEVYSDQTSTTDAAQLTQAATDALTAGAAVAKVAATVIDLPRIRFGADDEDAGIQGYREGDIVAVELHEGITYSDVVTSVQLNADADAGTDTVTPTIGAGDASDAATDQTATAQLTAQVRNLERQLKQLKRK
jgi:ReqiPepy6 Gp37-like protein